MSRYRVARYGGKYKDRQLAANRDGAICYVEHHFNALEYDRPGVKDNPALALIASNAGRTTRAWGALYARLVAEEFGNPNGGLLERKSSERGHWNLYYTKMPAILVEPLFISDGDQAATAITEEGQTRLAEVLYQSIRETFPNGGLVALSCGHAGNREGDRGAPAKINGVIVGWESELSEAVLCKTACLLLRDE